MQIKSLDRYQRLPCQLQPAMTTYAMSVPDIAYQIRRQMASLTLSAAACHSSILCQHRTLLIKP
eukprot:562262-Rhodomonas_salina.3